MEWNERKYYYQQNNELLTKWNEKRKKNIMLFTFLRSPLWQSLIFISAKLISQRVLLSGG